MRKEDTAWNIPTNTINTQTLLDFTHNTKISMLWVFYGEKVNVDSYLGGKMNQWRAT